MVKDLHQILLASARGKGKSPGNFRTVPVHIGKPGSSIEEAIYVPPEPGKIINLIQNWIKFVHSDSKDIFVKLAVSHYQFEAIHPFMDGNGRVGRLLIPIILYEQDVINYPYFYISEFFEQNRSDYYESLRAVDNRRDWDTWVRFFLAGVKETAGQMLNKIDRMYNLYGRAKEEALTINSQYAQLFLDLIFERPIVSSREILNKLEEPSPQTLYNLIDKFEGKGMIHEVTGNKRNKLYVFRKLLDIIQ